MLLELKNLTINFGATRAVRDLSLSIAAGESVGLVGESGSGKSATALAMMRLLPPQARVEGKILWNGVDVLGAPEEQVRSLRGRQMAMIFQEPMTALNPVMRVGDQVAEAWLVHQLSALHQRPFALPAIGPPEDPHLLKFEEESRRNERGFWSKPRAKLGFLERVGDPFDVLGLKGISGSAMKRNAWPCAVNALREVGIPDPEQRARSYPHQLSGGMRQRVMIAMAIVNRPQLLIADEPTTALDVTIQAQILELLAELRRKFNLAMLFISHDLAVVSKVTNRVAVMYAGAVVEMGSVSDIFHAPAHAYTRGLLNSVPTLATDRARPLKTIEDAARTSSEAVALREIAPGHWARVAR